LDKDSLIFDPKPDPGSSQPDGRVSDVLRLRDDERESNQRAERRRFSSEGLRRLWVARPPRLGLSKTPALFDRENERRRVECEDCRAPALMRGRGTEKRFVKRYRLGGLIDV
jgi:hypothetical protein